MNRAFSKALVDCISRMEGGAGVDDCLKAHPSLASELRPQLEAWQAMGSGSVVQPSTAAIEGGRQAMLVALKAAPERWTPLTALRLAPAWTTAAAAVAAFAFLLGGAAGASAALGGPDPAGDVLSAVGVSSNSDNHGGIGDSSASDRGLECANPNAFEGSANSKDKGQSADDAHQKQPCSKGTDEGAGADKAGQQGDGNNGHGNDAGHDDASNPGQGQGNHGTKDGSNAGGNGNDNSNGNANPGEPQGQGNGLNKNQP